MDTINQILTKIKDLLFRLEFREVRINGRINYVFKNLYCIPQYVEAGNFLIEYARSLDEVQDALYKNGEIFSLAGGEDTVLEGLEREIYRKLNRELENNIPQILNRIKDLLLHMEFQEVYINGRINYVFKNMYCIPQYVKGLGILIEYADSLDEAQKNIYEDGDSYLLIRGEDLILKELEKEIRSSLENSTT